MIFPGDFRELTVRPGFRASWVLVFLNVGLFLLTTLMFDPWPSSEMQSRLNDTGFKRSVYEMYLQTLDPLERRALAADEDDLENLNAVFARALKDQKFWDRVGEFPFYGDQVQIAETRQIITEFRQSYLKSPQHQFGLSSLEVSPWAWLTYQFVHASLIHLLGNLLLIFLVMSYLEKTVSETWLVAVYLLSGFAGGVSFLYFDTVGSMAVVGASASATGLLSFLLAVRGHRLMPWGYVLAPVKGGYGQIHLPVFFVFPLFLVSDFVSLLWEPNGIAANVAVSAHVGGCLMGFLCGGVYLLFRRKAASHRIFGHDYGLHELP